MFKPKSKVSELAKRGVPAKEIADAIRRSPSTARRRMAEIGVNRPRGRPKALTDDQVETLYFRVKRDRVISLDHAASEAGVSARTLQRKFREFHRNRWRTRR